MRTRSEVDRLFTARTIALKGDVPAGLTPQHSAAEAAVGAGDDEDAKRRRRERIQHEVDPAGPYLHDAPEVAHADLGKLYNQAVNVPTGYPPLGPVSPGAFRKGPLTRDHAAYSTGYEPPLPLLLTPSSGPGLIARPLMTDGQPEVSMTALRGTG